MRATRFIAAALLALLLPQAAEAQALQSFEPHSLEQIVAKHRGRPFVLLVWSMDCEFCQASLDTLARARKADPGLDIVTVTTDPVADGELAGQVGKRLSSLALQDEAWGFGGQAPERLRFALDPRWKGEKPRSYWYDASGKRVARSGQITPAKLAQWRQ